jgi:flagellar hook-basal body complex protein FliE
MSIEAIAAPAAAGLLPVDPVTSTQTATPGMFDSLMTQLGALNTQLIGNQQAVAQLALGQTDNLHQVVMDSEQTKLSFELMLSLRNKVLDAYQELMRMQV